MRKRTRQAPTEAGAIATYTSDLSRRFRRSVPDEYADEIISEALAHLHDQADAIVAKEGGVSLADAEARAVAAFTPSAAFAGAMARSAYETRFSKTWHTAGTVIASVALGGLAAGFVVDALFTLPYSLGLAESFAQVVYLCLFPLFCLCAFLSRRVQTRYLLCSTLLVALFAFFCTGFFYVMPSVRREAKEVPQSRRFVQRQYDAWHNEGLRIEVDIRRLDEGLKVYSKKNPVVASALRGAKGRGYIVPYAIEANRILAHTRQKNATYYFPFSTPELPQQTVSTLAKARARWLTTGPQWLAQARYQKEDTRHYEERWKTTLQQTGFDGAAGRWYAADMIFSGLFLLLFDGLFAKLGRTVYTKRRARHARERAAQTR